MKTIGFYARYRLSLSKILRDGSEVAMQSQEKYIGTMVCVVFLPLGTRAGQDLVPGRIVLFHVKIIVKSSIFPVGASGFARNASQ
jgi:hypothetical protein